MGYSPRGHKESDLTERLALADQFPVHLSHLLQNFPSLGSLLRPQQPTVLAPFYQLIHSLICSLKCLLSVCSMPGEQVLPSADHFHLTQIDVEFYLLPENREHPETLSPFVFCRGSKAPTITPR